jgi:CheY-like chemotaxis protein
LALQEERFMGQPLRILLVEDSEDDAELLLRQLRKGGYAPTSRRVASEEQMTAVLTDEPWDIIISDYVMPGFGGLEALALFREKGLDIPFIIVSGHIGEDLAVAAMQAGADDYLMKDRLARTAPAVDRALRQAAIRRARKQAEEQLAASERQLREKVAELRLREEELRLRNDELSQARAELERRVEERTAALALANYELKNQMVERRRLENELLEIADNERRRIGFDLHDDLGQKLMGVSLLLKALETNLAHKHLAEAGDTHKIQALVQQVINHTHNLAHCFSSLDAEAVDVCQQFRKLAANVRKTFHIGCVFRSLGGVPELSGETHQQLYKITEESINNAIKHGKARRVTVLLVHRERELILRIKNDGIPFQAGREPTNRLGLRIMNYRAHLIGATLDIQPNGGSGTLVACSLAVHKTSSVSGSPRESAADRGGGRNPGAVMKPLLEAAASV